MNQKLFSKNFIILLIGQSLSMFGNNIIRFAISLYILEETQSASLYGIVTAVSYIPTILFSPFGGVLADRCNKKKLMIILDSSYCAIAIIMGSLFQRQGNFFLAASLLLILSVVSSFEGPVSSACIPLIQHSENLTRANAISNQISSLSGLIPPFLSGILYGIIGSSRFHTLMYLCAVFFFLAAGMELMLIIPQAPSTKYFTITETIRLDLCAVLHLIFKERKYIGETMLINGLMMFLVTPYLSIGTTYLISVKLHLPAFWNGTAQTTAGLAAILGGTFATLIAKKFQTKNLHLLLMAMGASFFLLLPAMSTNMISQTAFLLVCLTSVLVLFFANTAGVFILSGMQKACPKTMIGRLMAVFNTLNNLTLPIGIWTHGILYEKCEKHLPCLFGAIAVLTIGTAALGKRVYAQLQKTEDVYL